ncbi:MAG: hypothetical protein WCR52_12875 [Bacteroidota bacterium]
MSQYARQFRHGVDASAQSMDNLEHQSRQAEQAAHGVFNNGNAARFESSIGRINQGVNFMRNGLAALGVGTVLKEMSEFGDRMFTANALTAGITRNVNSMGDAQRRALALSNLTGESYLQSYEGLSQMLTVSEGNVSEAEKLTKLGAALAGLKPEEGFKGALFALKEIQSGDNMSLRERFGIRVPTGEEAKKIAQRDGRSIQKVMIDNLQEQLDKQYGGGKAGAGVEYLLKIRSNTIGGQMNRIGNNFKNIFTPLLLPFLEKTQSFLTGIGDWLQGNQMQIGQFFNNLVAKGQPLFDFLKDAAGQFIERAKSLWPVVQPLAQSIFRLFTAIAPPIVSIGKMFWSVLQPAFVVVGKSLTWIINGISGWIERNRVMINGFISGMGTVIKAVLGIGVAFVNIGLWIGQAIWDTVAFIGKMAAWAWENNPFTWMVNLVDRIFPGFKLALNGLWDWAKGLFTDLISWIWNNVFVKLGKWLGSIWEALGQGPLNMSLNVEGQQSVSPTDRGTDINDPTTDPNRAANLALFERLGIKDGQDKKQPGLKQSGLANIGMNDKLNSISGGGREGVKNININVQKLIESLNFYETKGVEGLKSIIRREIEQTLLDTVNKANYAN